MSNETLQILDVDAVMAAMQDYAEARGEHDAALAKYDGYSWDWHGSGYIDAVESAKDHAKDVLEKYIEACVRRAVERINPNGTVESTA